MQPGARLWQLSLLLIALAACQPPSRGSAQQPVSGGDLPIERVFTDPFASITEPRRAVIRDAAAWRDFWREAAPPREPAPTRPDVDFTTSMLLVAAMGQRGTGGYEIHIERVYERDGELIAVVREISPGAGCMLIQALTSPIEVVKIPRYDGPVSFVEERERRDCP